MTSKRHLIILNPIAGKGKAAEQIPRIEELLRAKDIKYELRLTTGVWNAAELAREAARELFDVVVAAGGDGTVNEVVNGLMLSLERVEKIPAMGVLAVGRGNDFCYGADIPGELEACVETLAEGRVRSMDVGRVVGGDYPQGRYFANGIGAGFDTIVGLEAAKMRRVHGFMAYVLGAAKTLIAFPRPPEVLVSFPGGQIAGRSPQVSIMNGKRLGGTFFYAPWAEDHDGVLDLLVADDLKRGQLVGLILSIAKGEHGSRPELRFAHASSIKVEAPAGGLVVHADGETICTDGKLLEIECLGSRIPLVCSPGLHPAKERP